MRQVLDAKGQIAAPAQTDVKKPHDAEEVKRARKHMGDVLKDCVAGFQTDTTNPPGQPIVVEADEAAARKLYGEKFRDAARVHNASSVCTKPVNESLAFLLIDQLIAQRKNDADLGFALHVLDLEKKGFLPVGAIDRGVLWISASCAVSVSPSGATNIWLRGSKETIEQWCSGWMPRPKRMPFIESHDYALRTLHKLLGAAGIARILPLTETQMNDCRKPVNPRASLYHRWFGMALLLITTTANAQLQHFGQNSMHVQCNGLDSAAQSFSFPGGTLDSVRVAWFSRFSIDHPATLRILQGDGTSGDVLFEESIIVPGVDAVMGAAPEDSSPVGFEAQWNASFAYVWALPNAFEALAPAWSVGQHFDAGTYTVMVSLDTSVNNAGYTTITTWANCFTNNCSPIEGDLYSDGALYWGNPPIPFDPEADAAFRISWHADDTGIYSPPRDGDPLSHYMAFDMVGRLVAEGTIDGGRLQPQPPIPSVVLLRREDGSMLKKLITDQTL